MIFKPQQNRQNRYLDIFYSCMGVIRDENLEWNEHIPNVARKISDQN